MEVWPNPAREILNFKFSILNSGKEYTLDIYNPSGIKLQEIKLDNLEGDFKLNLLDLQEGVYVLVIRENNRLIATRRFIKVN